MTTKQMLNCCFFVKIDLSSNSPADESVRLNLDDLESTQDSPTASTAMEKNSANDGNNEDEDIDDDDDDNDNDNDNDECEDNDDEGCVDNDEETIEINEFQNEDNLEMLDMQENTSLSWSSNGVSRIGTSVVEGTGLKELLQLLDKNIGLNQRPGSEIEA